MLGEQTFILRQLNYWGKRMLTEGLLVDVRVRTWKETSGVADAISSPIPWGSGDLLADAEQLLGTLTAQDTESTACSPVIPTSELRRIRDNVLAQFNILRNSYSNVGNSLNATGLVAQYQAVFRATEGGSYCHYSSDGHLVRDIQNCTGGANQILTNAITDTRCRR
jgi:hypothetical protein